MAEVTRIYSEFSGGIADFTRADRIPFSYAFAQSIDVRSDPYNATVLPRTIKESGTVVQGLPKWFATYLPTTLTFVYDDVGSLYSRTSAGSYTNLRQVSGSHGNGLVYSPEDDYLWYALDTVVGRYGPISSASPTFNDNAFASFGGVPLNTNSLDLESSSSQYASRADTASLSITGNLAIDVQIKPESLPTVGNQMVLVSKWDESGTTRSYKFDIAAVSGYFGDGSDGALTISANTTEAPIDSAATATSGTLVISATNASFAGGQVIVIMQMRGSGAGTWERSSILSYTAGTIHTQNALMGTYTAVSQVRVFKQYTNVTVDITKTYTTKAWNGTVGGMLGFIASGTFTYNGTVSANGGAGANGAGGGGEGGGFRGGDPTLEPSIPAFCGEGTGGASAQQTGANGNGGGGGSGSGGGAAGGNGTTGFTSTYPAPSAGTVGGVSGSADLTTMCMGGGGGGCTGNGIATVGGGGAGGGIVFIIAATITKGSSGLLTANGGAGGGDGSNDRFGAGGAGGSILLKAQTATLGTGQITATGGIGAFDANGGDGRIHLDYYTSYTGTTSPTLDATQDNSLVTSTTYQLRLSVSSTGLNTETLAYEAPLMTATWQQVGVSWLAASSIATFTLNGGTLGTRTGTLTAIHDNASTFQVGMSKNGAGSAANFYDGLIDEVRLFNMIRTEAQMFEGISSQIPTNTAGLAAYYKFNGGYTDATANANTLTSSGAPVFSSDVPFPSPTTRLDIDQQPSPTPSGNTYAVPTAISEATVDRLTFTPGKDPQKSIQFNVANIGTGTWNGYIHDANNFVVATFTVTTANMHTGLFEFFYTSVWSPLTNFTNEYHAHLTCASGSPTVVSGTSNNLETAAYVTYYQLLITDTDFHPMEMFLNFWVIGNGRYLGKYEAPLYEPNLLNFGGSWRVRALADWREYKAIGVMQGTRIDKTEKGRVYFWDGYSSTFNFYIDVPEGGINAMKGSRGKLFIIAGYKNQLLVYEGGDTAQKLRDMPNIETGAYSGVYPQGLEMYQSLLRYSTAAEGDSTDVYKGVYTYGSTNIRYPDILTYDYPISTGNTQGTGLQIGAITVVNKKLLIGWRDGLGAGVDYVAEGNMPYPTSFMQFLIEDMGDVTKQKLALESVAVFNTLDLTDNQSVVLSYDLNSSGIFTTNPDTAYQNEDTLSRMFVTAPRIYEAQIKMALTAGVAPPVVRGVSFIANPLNQE